MDRLLADVGIGRCYRVTALANRRDIVKVRQVTMEAVVFEARGYVYNMVQTPLQLVYYQLP